MFFVPIVSSFDNNLFFEITCKGLPFFLTLWFRPYHGSRHHIILKFCPSLTFRIHQNMPIICIYVHKKSIRLQTTNTKHSLKLHLLLDYTWPASKPCGAPNAVYMSLKPWECRMTSSAIHTCAMLIVNHIYINTKWKWSID